MDVHGTVWEHREVQLLKVAQRSSRTNCIGNVERSSLLLISTEKF
jgi:hypothetical protein